MTKTIWIPTAHWMEEKPILLSLTRYQRNVFENLDLNQYFFAGHPKERLGNIDFEKFNLIFIPFTLYGWIILAHRKYLYYWSYLIIMLLIVGFWGNQISIGPIVLFPTITTAISIGLQKFTHQLSEK